MKKTLATSISCGPCHMLKSKIAKLGLEVETKDFSREADREFFKKHDIRAVPRLIIEDDDGKVSVVQGIEDIIKELQNV